MSPVLAFLTINVFTNAAEALPCELPRPDGLSVGTNNNNDNNGKKGISLAMTEEQLDVTHPTWKHSRMNPLLLFEGLRQVKDRMTTRK